MTVTSVEVRSGLLECILVVWWDSRHLCACGRWAGWTMTRTVKQRFDSVRTFALNLRKRAQLR